MRILYRARQDKLQAVRCRSLCSVYLSFFKQGFALAKNKSQGKNMLPPYQSSLFRGADKVPAGLLSPLSN